MGAYGTDRQTVERLLLPAMMQVVLTMVIRGLGDQAAPLVPAQELLTAALREPLDQLASVARGKLVRRAHRVTEAVMAPLQDELIGTQVLAVAQYIAWLTQRQMLAVGAESAFGRAWDAVAEVFNVAAEEIDPRLVDAVAAGLGQRLQAQGYFRVGSAEAA